MDESSFRNVRCVISDVDGVLTSGQIVINHEGHETKVFHVQDGLGIKLLLENQIEFAVITSRDSAALTHRMHSLGVKHFYQGQKDKRAAFQQILADCQVRADEVAYVGDDWPDLTIMKQVALPIAVANAVPEVKAIAKYVTTVPGGSGAVREVAMLLLKAQNKFEAALESY